MVNDFIELFSIGLRHPYFKSIIYFSSYINFIINEHFRITLKGQPKLNSCYRTPWNGRSTAIIMQNLAKEADKDLQ
jgi:hypothetical protein